MSVEKRLVVWRDIHHAARVWHDGCVRFEVLDLVGFDTGSGRPVFWPQGSDAAHPATEDPDKAVVLAEVDIKFDGCSHWAFRAGHALHLCGRDDAQQFAAMMVRLFDEARRLFGASWDDF